MSIRWLKLIYYVVCTPLIRDPPRTNQSHVDRAPYNLIEVIIYNGIIYKESEMPQIIYNPADYEFEWTSPTPEKPMGWYKWDSKVAHRLALRDRNKNVKLLRENGTNPVSFSLKDQLITRGGIGSGHSEISLVVTCYGLNY